MKVPFNPNLSMILTRAFVQTEGKDTLMKTCKQFASFPMEDSAGIRPSQEPVIHILSKYCLGNKPLNGDVLQGRKETPDKHFPHALWKITQPNQAVEEGL